MKTKKIIFYTLISIILPSCVSTSYYQVYKVTPSNNEFALKDKALIYEDNNCQLSYNLWKDGGNIGFHFYNKTDKNIYLNLNETFFIINNVSYNYYRNRVFTNSSSSSSSSSKSASVSNPTNVFNYLNFLEVNQLSSSSANSLLSSSGYSVSYKEDEIICIPSKTSKFITEYEINNSIFRDCDLYLYPTSKKNIKSKSFSKSDSPFIFSNRIVYSIGKNDIRINIENEFYVSEITNYPEKEIIEKRSDNFCDNKNTTQLKFFKNFSPDKFYIKYDYNKYDDSIIH